MASKLKSFQIMLIFILPMMLEFEDVLSEAHNWQTKTRPDVVNGTLKESVK